AAESGKAGFSTTFVDVTVLDVPRGEPRRIQDPRNESLVLRNLGDVAVHVRGEALLPAASELRPPAKPIPDKAWIRNQPPELEIPAHGQAESEISILVPRERAYAGRWYQVMIWSHGSPIDGGGLKLSAGLKSRLRFQVSSK